MKAVVHNRYGAPDVLHVREVERPTPKEDELLVRVHSSSVTRSDTGMRSLEYPFSRLFTGIRRPKRTIAGSEFAGVVEDVGSAVTEFRVGDEVFGIKGGANAEYVCVREAGVVAHKPAELSWEEAGAIADGALLSLTCMRSAYPVEGKSVVVYGAGGSMGTAAVQLLVQHFGADVTAVCDTRDIELVRSLGATEVVDRLEDDFTKNGKTYDVVYDAVGKTSFRRVRRSLKPGGIYVSADLGFMYHVPLVVLGTRFMGDKRATLGLGTYKKSDLLVLKDLIEAGKYRPIVDRVYPLEDVVEATRYVETGQKTGNVVLSLNGAGR
ncbi:MAG TPA: NAD(P)-dependent alcohol dehydrogenase [Gaiellaceae bacterium]|nr:NAD(P)-dependent alcohol dehydrogenase [Gaiellaceae bacterium]